MKSSFHKLVPFLPLSCICQLNSISIPYPGRLVSRTRLYPLYCSIEFCFITTLLGPHGKHRLLLSCIVLGVFTATLHSNGRGFGSNRKQPLYCWGVFTAGSCLPSLCLAMAINVTILTCIQVITSTLSSLIWGHRIKCIINTEGNYATVAPFSQRRSDSITGQVVWDLWLTNGTGTGVLRLLQFLLSILIPPTAAHSSILSALLCSLDTDSVIKLNTLKKWKLTVIVMSSRRFENRIKKILRLVRTTYRDSNRRLLGYESSIQTIAPNVWVKLIYKTFTLWFLIWFEFD
jgi:hypothetical protein